MEWILTCIVLVFAAVLFFAKRSRLSAAKSRTSYKKKSTAPCGEVVPALGV